MSKIVGKYQHVSNDNFEEFMKSLGHPELVAPFLKSKPIVDVQKNGEQWTISVNAEGNVISSTFKLNEPYEEKLPASQLKFQSVSRLEGNTVRTETQLGDGHKVVRVYDFSDTEMKVHLSSNKSDVKALRTYKRI